MQWLAQIALLTVIAGPVFAHAQSNGSIYPARPVRVVVPFPPGGPVDGAARVIAQKLTEMWGQQFVIDNRTGAGGNIGTEIAARAKPDGYTVLLGATGPMAINPALYAKLPFDPVKDFTAVAGIKRHYYLLLAHPSLPAKSIRELIQLAASGGRPLTQASSGIGSSAHITGEMLKSMAKVHFLHVPYRGAGPSLTAVVAGEASFMFLDSAIAMPHAKSGRVKVIAVAGPRRVAEFPEVATLAESGYGGADPAGWSVLFFPARTPKGRIETLNAAVKGILQSADVQKMLGTEGVDFDDNTPELVTAFLKSEIAKWAKMVKVSGARAD